MKPLPFITVLSDARAQTARAGGALLAMWASVTALAALAAAPVTGSFWAHHGRSFDTGRLVVELDPAAVAEWLRASQGDPANWIPWLLGAALALVWPLSVFWAGGALGRLANRTGFMEGGARHFWPFLRLSLLAGLFYAAALAAYAAGGRAVEEFFKESMEYRPLALARMGLNAALAAAVWLIASGFDYAKARMVTDEAREAVKAGFAGVAFVLRHPWRALAPLAFIGLAGAALFAFYQTAYNVFDYRGMRTILISAAGQQIYVGLRLWLRLWQWAACCQVDLGIRRPSSPWALSAPEPYGDNI
jgi:hypothetical protein